MDENTAWDANAAMGNQNFGGGGNQDGNPPTGDGRNAWELMATGWLQTQNEGNDGQDEGDDGQKEGGDGDSEQDGDESMDLSE
jgi:hypothetical protein